MAAKELNMGDTSPIIGDTIAISNDDSKSVHRTIPGHPGYAAGDDGTIWTAWKQRIARGSGGMISGTVNYISSEWKIRVPYRNPGRYRGLCLRNKGKSTQVKVCVLVLLAFSGPRPRGALVRHLNDKKYDDRLRNLKWGTLAENVADKIANNRQPRGEKQGSSKLTACQVKEIRNLAANGMTQREIAGLFLISRSHAGRIIRRIWWRHVQ